MKLGQVFDPRKNALNALRLALAAEVMLFHSWPITGHTLPKTFLQLLFSVGVDGFLLSQASSSLGVGSPTRACATTSQPAPFVSCPASTSA